MHKRSARIEKVILKRLKSRKAEDGIGVCKKKEQIKPQGKRLEPATTGKRDIAETVALTAPNHSGILQSQVSQSSDEARAYESPSDWASALVQH